MLLLAADFILSKKILPGGEKRKLPQLLIVMIVSGLAVTTVNPVSSLLPPAEQLAARESKNYRNADYSLLVENQMCIRDSFGTANGMFAEPLA